MTTPIFRIVMFIFPQMTHLDFTGPHQVFSRIPDTSLHVVSTHGGEVVSQEGLRIAGTEALADFTACDLLFIPGGFGITQVVEDAWTLDRLTALAAGADYVTSVCTGSMILAAAGLLKGRRATSHWTWRPQLAAYGALPEDGRVVRDGKFITGGGVTAGIDFAFTVAAELRGEQFAKTLQLMLEYGPQPPFTCGSPDLADEVTRAQVEATNGPGLAGRIAAFDRAVSARAASAGGRAH